MGAGGPLYQGAVGANRTIIGLTSFGARGCIDYKPTIFTRVDFYVPEIKKGTQSYLLTVRSQHLASVSLVSNQQILGVYPKK